MKKRLLCIHQGYELYGSDRSFIRSLRAIREQFSNIEITVVLPKKGILVDHIIPYIDNLKIKDVGILRKSDFNDKGFTTFFQLISKIVSSVKLVQTYDYLYVNSIVAIGCIIPTIFLKKKLSIIHIREIPTGFIAIFFSILLKLSCAKLIFNSHSTKEAFHFVENRRSNVVYNGVKGYNSILPFPQTKRINILLLGRLNSWKGQSFLVQAIGQIKKKYLDKISVRIVGDYFENQKKYYEELKKLKSTLKIGSTISIHPFTEDPSEHYAWAHIVVVPSTKPEPFGLVAIEAMSAGRPVIGSNHGGLTEIIIHNKTGVLIKPGNKCELNNAIISFIENQERIAEFGSAGRARFEQIFHEDRYNNSIKELFQRTIGNEKTAI